MPSCIARCVPLSRDKETDESRVDAVSYGTVPPFLLVLSVVKLAKENGEPRVDAVVYDMMPLLPDVSLMRPWCLRSRAARTLADFLKVARSA